MWEVFEFIESIAGNYTYYVGHHSPLIDESVLYAIQKDRI